LLEKTTEDGHRDSMVLSSELPAVPHPGMEWRNEAASGNSPAGGRYRLKMGL
jgi:hypothetical protein